MDVPPPLKDCVPPGAAAGTDMVIVFPEAPTDAIPAPERLKLLPIVTVVESDPRVFPTIDPVMVEYAKVFIIVRSNPPTVETLIPEPPR
jgi:hypothetical protein